MHNFSEEIVFQTARSGGKGGQNVNKVATMVQGNWHVDSTKFFNEAERALIAKNLRHKINLEGYLQIKSSATRSQLQNKALVIAKMLQEVQQALIIKKFRIPTKPSKKDQLKRLEQKKLLSVRKNNRKKKWDE